MTRQLSDVEILIGELLAEVNGNENSPQSPLKNITLCVSCFLEIQNSRNPLEMRRVLVGLKRVWNLFGCSASKGPQRELKRYFLGYLAER